MTATSIQVTATEATEYIVLPPPDSTEIKQTLEQGGDGSRDDILLRAISRLESLRLINDIRATIDARDALYLVIQKLDARHISRAVNEQLGCTLSEGIMKDIREDIEPNFPTSANNNYGRKHDKRNQASFPVAASCLWKVYQQLQEHTTNWPKTLKAIKNTHISGDARLLHPLLEDPANNQIIAMLASSGRSTTIQWKYADSELPLAQSPEGQRALRANARQTQAVLRIQGDYTVNDLLRISDLPATGLPREFLPRSNSPLARKAAKLALDSYIEGNHIKAAEHTAATLAMLPTRKDLNRDEIEALLPGTDPAILIELCWQNRPEPLIRHLETLPLKDMIKCCWQLEHKYGGRYNRSTGKDEPSQEINNANRRIKSRIKRRAQQLRSHVEEDSQAYQQAELKAQWEVIIACGIEGAAPQSVHHALCDNIGRSSSWQNDMLEQSKSLGISPQAAAGALLTLSRHDSTLPAVRSWMLSQNSIQQELQEYLHE